MKIKVIDKEINEEKVAKIVRLNTSHIDEVLDLQEEIMTALVDKTLFSPSDREEYLSNLGNDGVVLGVVLEENNELIAYGVFCKPGNVESNYGNDIGLSEDELEKVGHIESTIVKVRYRGNSLQKILCKELEKISKENGATILCATASPINPHSVNTFVNLGYKIVKEKLKYGGLRRYVLEKRL